LIEFVFSQTNVIDKKEPRTFDYNLNSFFAESSLRA